MVELSGIGSLFVPDIVWYRDLSRQEPKQNSVNSILCVNPDGRFFSFVWKNRIPISHPNFTYIFDAV